MTNERIKWVDRGMAWDCGVCGSFISVRDEALVLSDIDVTKTNGCHIYTGKMLTVCGDCCDDILRELSRGRE